MKLFFISDIHGSLQALNRSLERFEASRADYLVILGDFLNHGPRNALPAEYEPAMVASRLNEYADKIIAVRGNCDSEVDQGLLSFPIDAPYNQLLFEGRRFFLTHGHLYDPENLPVLGDGDIFCYGHVHTPVARRQGNNLIFNPGSISLPRGQWQASYGLADSQGIWVRQLSDDQLVLFQEYL